LIEEAMSKKNRTKTSKTSNGGAKDSKGAGSPNQEMERLPWGWYKIKVDYLQPFGEAFLLAMVIRTFIIQPFYIPTGSMEPTIHGVQPGGDRIFANKVIYGIRIPFTERRVFRVRRPRSGDIVVFNTLGLDVKDKEGKNYVKRVVATGGQKVLIRDGYLYLDGEKTDLHEHTADKHYYNQQDRGGHPMPYAQGDWVEVPEGMLFCLGDNSGDSLDSRYWGFVPEQNVLGRAFLRWWPLPRIGLLDRS